MTKQELNRDIKRLYNKFDKLAGDDFISSSKQRDKKSLKDYTTLIRKRTT